jgi:DNA-binding Lrp family transcriptional regulator
VFEVATMTNFEKWEAAMVELKRDAVRSDRQIAQALGFSATFVGKVRKKLEDDNKLQRGKRLGHDGRRRGLPRTMKEKRERLLVLLKRKEKHRKDIQELAAWVRKIPPRQLEKHLAALEGETVASLPPDEPSQAKAEQGKMVPTSDDELLKWGIVAGMVEDQHWTEERAVAIAPEVLDEVGPDERQRLIERGKGYWSRTRSS